MTTHLAIKLLGEFSLTTAENEAVNFSGDRPITLLAYLLLHRHMPVSRQHLAFTLWPDSTENQARANLRNLFYTLRQTLPQADQFIAADSMTLQWRHDACFTLDVAEFELAMELAGSAAAESEKIACLESAVNLYQGDLLPGNYDDWIIPLREELRQNYLDALNQLVLLWEQKQDFRQAGRYSKRLVQQDPLNESGYIHLMRLLALSGDRTGVRRIYESCVTILRRELNVEPAAATQAAYERFLRLEVGPQEPDLKAVSSQEVHTQGPPVLPLISSPPLHSPRPLPTPPTPFFGREPELAHLAKMLADPTCRLVTIVGPGGMGKTRLALQTAINHQPAYADGAAFVTMDAECEAMQIISTVASALNFIFMGHGDPREELFDYLHGKQMLIVLDNIAGLPEENAFIAELLWASPELMLVITSRERLNVPGEWLFPLDGLPSPPLDAQVVNGSVAENPAVRLFLHSARRLRPNFAPDVHDWPALSRICALVSGMPLALELAASWIQLLSCGEIAAELEQGLDFLAAPHRHVTPGRRSIREVFDTSWNMLAPAEQQLLARLSIFRGSFTREAAKQVAGATLPQLAALVDKSFVRPAQSGRHSLHELIRQYAADRLANQPEQEQASAMRHRNYYLQLLVDEEPDLCSARQKEVIANLTADKSNLLDAWKRAAQRPDPVLLRAAAWPFWYYFELLGLFSEGEAAFRQAETVLATLLARQETAPAGLRIAHANIQTHRAYFSFRLGNSLEARQTLNNVIALLRDGEDEEALGDALLLEGSMHWFGEAYAAAADVTREVLALSHRRQRPWQIVVHTVTLGVMLLEMGEYEEAYQLLSDGLGRARELGDPRCINFAAGFFSRISQEMGRPQGIAELLYEGLQQAKEMNDPFAMGTTLEQLGNCALAGGQFAEAYQYFNESLSVFRNMGDNRSLVRMLNHLGDVRLRAGDIELAEHDFREALAIAAAGDMWPAVYHALNGLAQVYAQQGNDDLVWALTSILKRQPISSTMQEQAKARQQEVLRKLSPAEQTAALRWIGDRPLPALVQDVLTNQWPNGESSTAKSARIFLEPEK